MTMRMTRRSVLGLAGAAAAGLTVAGCGTSGPAGRGGGAIQLWVLQSDTENPVLKRRIDAFNKHSSVKVAMTTYVNDPYKQKLQVAMGSPNAPDIFFNWGGGNLAQFVDAGQVQPLDAALADHPAVAKAFLPSVLAGATLGGKRYGLPMSGMQPEVLFYNKTVFDAAGATPPTSYPELLKLVDTFKRKGITPIALAGAQGWTELIYLMYFTDRIGGPDVVDALVAKKPGAWRHPAIRAAAEHCVELVERGAFGTNYPSVSSDNQAASKLLATGKCAMHVMGSWEYQTQVASSPKFVSGHRLGWVPFPSVPGGKGDAKNVVGVPTNYFSVVKGGKHVDQATRFLLDTLAGDPYVGAMIGIGEIPPVNGIKPKLAASKAADFATFCYDLVSAAPHFQLAWDQALSPSVGTAVNTNVQKLFVKQLDPAGFVKAMDAAA
jgi:raffinose/stachyose/melibiose transport system substrate-binding protein/xylobiose transport system substrate-binding protein